MSNTGGPTTSQPEPAAVAAFVGATGGAGTTRTTVEVASTLAADGREVAIIDAAFGTQGLADYVEGRIDPDVTGLVTDDAAADLSAGMYPFDADPDVTGRVAVCPAHAPFARLARAKSAEAARRLESRIATAAARFDHVLIDVPPLASNHAVAAVHAADTVAVIAPSSRRGAEAVQQCHGRLADVGAEASLVVSVRGELETADIAVPATDEADVGAAPASLGDGAFAAGIGRVAAAVTGRTSTDADTAKGGVFGAVGEYLGR
jgi:cellulose biosynthesis protein BcsQ